VHEQGYHTNVGNVVPYYLTSELNSL
jgi:hypothetical protein